MIILLGNNLGARQKDLNEKVNEALKSNVSFDTLVPGPVDTEKPEEADADKLFKIDLAARYKNVHYILEIVKSNNSLYLSRALQKCVWLGDKEFDVNINVKNFHENIFPHISIRIKKKLLCSLSMYVKDENRAAAFHEYCMELNLHNAAMKFLQKTSESYKQDIIQQETEAIKLLSKNQNKYLVLFIGQSFVLADDYLRYLEEANYVRNNALYLLRHLYSVSKVQYLNLLEKYTWVDCEPFRLGSRLSKNVMESHKDRVLKNPGIYLNILDKKTISRKCTVNEAKVYAVNLLPEEARVFWHNKYEMYKYIFDIIPETERFTYVKKIFTEKYDSEPFETCLEFHTFKFYNIMTTEEKEDWALQHVASGEELLGSGNDFMWYEFVNFNKAFEEIKKYILITSDSYKRLEILKVLIDSVKHQNDLETLIKYYYTRHVNESIDSKHMFLDYLMERHKVFNFNEKCWNALEKIFYSLEVFNKLKYNDCNSDFRVIAVIYYILRKDVVLEILNDYIDMDIIFLHRLILLSSDLSVDEKEDIFQYFLQFYLTKVEALHKETLNYDIEVKIFRYIDLTLNLLTSFKRKEDIIPELIQTLIKLNWDSVKNHSFYHNPEDLFSEMDIVKSIKTDATQITKIFPKIKKYIEAGHNTNWLVYKLKIYFHNDVAPQYLQLVNKCLSSDLLHYSLIKCAVYTIFNLADDQSKDHLMDKYLPTSAKIDHATISQKNLNFQRAICSVACFTRPPLPFKSIIPYIIGDYVKYCLPIFNFYMMNLPLHQSIVFIMSLISKPVSVQKHGLRLAFLSFSTENLTNLIKDIWKKSKNVTMRKNIYKALFDKVVEECGQKQLALFDVLKTLTLDLRADDKQEVFDLLTNHRLDDLSGHLIICAWAVVKTFPEKPETFKRIANVVTAMDQWYVMVPEDVLIAMIDEHVSNMLDKKQILDTDFWKGDEDQEVLYSAKWMLTARYLTCVYNDEQMKRNLEVIKQITKRVIEMWNEVRNEKYVMREFCSSFLINLEEKSYDVHKVETYSNVTIMFRTILGMLQDMLPKQETYLLTWQLRLSDIARNIIINGKEEFKNELDGSVDQVSKALKTNIHRFAEAFGNLVIEYNQSGMYFASFRYELECCISHKLSKINQKLDVFEVVSFNTSDLHVIMCTGLLKFEFSEMYIFILDVLPHKYNTVEQMGYYSYRLYHPNLVEDYKQVLETIKAFNNDEVQYYAYKKFVLDG